MVNFTIELAGILIKISCRYDTTKIYCRDYLCEDFGAEDVPGFTVSVTQADIDRERAETKAYELSHDGVVHDWPDKYLETLALYRKIAEGIADYDVILMHGSAIAVDGQGYLFTAPSGMGKSTHARLWRELLSDEHDVVMINDDKPLLRFFDDRIMVCGTPWGGKHRLSKNTSVPLKAVGKIERGDFDRTEVMKESDKWPLLVGQTYRPESMLALERVLGLLDRMKNKIPFYIIHCDMRQEAAERAWEAMRERR